MSRASKAAGGVISAGTARVSEWAARAACRRLLNGWGVWMASWEEEEAVVCSGDEGTSSIGWAGDVVLVGVGEAAKVIWMP
jgi:hypothetical protein